MARAYNPLEYVTVYILCTAKGLYYCGITNNLSRRLKEHDERGCVARFMGGVGQLVWAREFQNRTVAAKVERKVKRQGVKHFYERTKFSGSNNCNAVV